MVKKSGKFFCAEKILETIKPHFLHEYWRVKSRTTKREGSRGKHLLCLIRRGRGWGYSAVRISRSLHKEKGYQRGSMTFWCGSWSADLCLWLIDPDPAIFFIIELRDANKTQFLKFFSAYYFSKVHLHHFSKIKSQKESQNSRNQGFSYYFCMMIEGSGSIPLTNGSRRPKNMWILIRIRIRNTAGNCWIRNWLVCVGRLVGAGSSPRWDRQGRLPASRRQVLQNFCKHFQNNTWI